MTKLVVDVSVVVKWTVPEIHEDAADRMLGGDAELIAPDLLVAELAQALVRKLRQNEITNEQAVRGLLHAGTRCTLHPCGALARPAFQLAQSDGRSVYDCLYLALALEQGCQLVTADRKFLDAVVRHLPETMVWIEDVDDTG